MVRHLELQPKAVDLREHARKTEVGCLVRIPGVCNWSPTCLAHLREANVAGVGQKPPDICGVICCDSCHSVIDGRAHVDGMTKTDVRAMLMHALVRTLAYYEKLGMRMFEQP